MAPSGQSGGNLSRGNSQEENIFGYTYTLRGETETVV